jgi:hypothetical protein
VETGVFEALCAKLPFDIIGATSIMNSTRGTVSSTTLSLLVLTSDDVRFATAMSEPIIAEDPEPIRACYETALAKLPGKPALMLSYFPLLTDVSCDYFLDRMSEISENVPNFGEIAVDHNPDYRDSMVLLNGEYSRNRTAILLLYGNISPSFYVGSISRERIFPERGLVTSSLANHLISVNDMPIIDYFLSIGLKKNEDGSIAGLNSFPLLLDLSDGTLPMARAVIGLTKEGAGICGGSIPTGAILSIGAFDPEEIQATTSRTVKEAISEISDKKHSALLVFSCIGRFLAQGLDQSAEINRIVETITGAGVPYIASYSGGELCPVFTADGSVINRNHNNSIVICAL